MPLKSISFLFIFLLLTIPLQAQNTYEIKYEFNDILSPTMEAAFDMASMDEGYKEAYEKITKTYSLKTDPNQSYFTFLSRDMRMIDTIKLSFQYQPSPDFYAHKNAKTGYFLYEDGSHQKKEFPDVDLEWEIVKAETREIAGYTCQKAIAYNEDGEVSSIWFTPTINSAFGPFLYSYPNGLILALETPIFKMQATCVSLIDETLSPPPNLNDKRKKRKQNSFPNLPNK